MNPYRLVCVLYLQFYWTFPRFNVVNHLFCGLGNHILINYFVIVFLLRKVCSSKDHFLDGLLYFHSQDGLHLPQAEQSIQFIC